MDGHNSSDKLSYDQLMEVVLGLNKKFDILAQGMVALQQLQQQQQQQQRQEEPSNIQPPSQEQHASPEEPPPQPPPEPQNDHRQDVHQDGQDGSPHGGPGGVEQQVPSPPSNEEGVGEPVVMGIALPMDQDVLNVQEQIDNDSQAISSEGAPSRTRSPESRVVSSEQEHTAFDIAPPSGWEVGSNGFGYLEQPTEQPHLDEDRLRTKRDPPADNYAIFVVSVCL